MLWDGVHQPGHPEVGRSERRGLALHRSRQAAARHAFIESFNGSLRDELLNEKIFDTLDDARRKIALWRYDYNAVRPHASLGNPTPLQARRTLALPDGSAPGALAMKPPAECQSQTGKPSL